MATDEDTTTPGRRIVSAELLIATLALLASAIASVATIFQTRTIGDQLSASVWPYLTNATVVDRATRSGTQVGFGFTNEGLGPALVRSYVVSVGGRAIGSWSEGLARAGLAATWHETTESDFGVGSVIRPGETVNIVRFAARPERELRVLQAKVERFSSSVCYCSLLQNCWTLASGGTEPEPVRRCDPSVKPISQ